MAGGIAALQRNGGAGRLAKGLGCFSVALGAGELLAPRAITRFLGMPGCENLVRAYGIREIGTGIGILLSANPTPWIWGRVGGDALDLLTVSAGLAGRRKGRVLLSLASLAGVTMLDIVCAGQRSLPGHEAAVERSITIGRPAAELYQRWRDPGTLAQVMSHFAAVRASGDGHMHWRMEGPAGSGLEWDTESIETSPNQSIGWRSLPDAPFRNEGSVRFTPATGNRGTVMTLRVRFDPPGGAVGRIGAELLGGLIPAEMAEKTLRRFKSLIETGEIPTTRNQPAARADTR